MVITTRNSTNKLQKTQTQQTINTRSSTRSQRPQTVTNTLENDRKLKLDKLKKRLSKNSSKSKAKDASILKIITKNQDNKEKDISENNLISEDNSSLEDTSSPSTQATAATTTHPVKVRPQSFSPPQNQKKLHLSTEISNDQTNQFCDLDLGKTSQFVHLDDNVSGEIKNRQIGNLDSDSSNPKKLVELEVSVDQSIESGSVSSEVIITKDIGKKPTPTMGDPSEKQKYDALVDLCNKLGQMLIKEGDNGNGNGKGKVNVGPLTSSEYEKFGMKISEVEAVETHPWLIYVKSHNSAMVDIPIKIAKIDDVFIRKAILTYVRNVKGELSLYHKLLLQSIEKEPVGIQFTNGSSFLVRLLNYLDNENKADSLTENGFILEVNKIDRQLHAEEMYEFRKQLQSQQQSSSKSFFSSNTSENRKIDKHESFKVKYPNYKGYCLDWNVGGHCKRGDKCTYRHECLHCLNYNEGKKCGNQARNCDQKE